MIAQTIRKLYLRPCLHGSLLPTQNLTNNQNLRIIRQFFFPCEFRLLRDLTGGSQVSNYSPINLMSKTLPQVSLSKSQVSRFPNMTWKPILLCWQREQRAKCQRHWAQRAAIEGFFHFQRKSSPVWKNSKKNQLHPSNPNQATNQELGSLNWESWFWDVFHGE